MKTMIFDFLKFRSFITHNIIKVLFWIVSSLTLLAYPLMILLATIQEGIGAGIGVIFLGGLTVVFGILMARVYAELVIVIFGIHDELKRINDRQETNANGNINAGVDGQAQHSPMM